ncbi:thioredoxin family protein [Pseudomonadota bacterium]
MSAVRALEQFEFHHTLESSTGTAIVFFSSQECSSCRYWEELLGKYVATHDNSDVFKVDAGQDQALVEEFGVFHLPALYLYKDGEYHSPIQCEAKLSEIEKAIKQSLEQPAQESP